MIIVAETPDFEKIANVIEDEHWNATDITGIGTEQRRAAIAEQLRLVWNARGAADIAKIDHELSSMMGTNMAGPYAKNLDRALRTLDR